LPLQAVAAPPPSTKETGHERNRSESRLSDSLLQDIACVNSPDHAIM
jgi:hypothetical protein